MFGKCNKYETLFIFGSEKELDEHLRICRDCREEHEKMNETANLVKEVKPYYSARKNKLNSNLIKIAAGITVLFLTSFSIFSLNHIILDNKTNNYSLSIEENKSVVSDMGLPTDDYGLLMVY